MTTASTPTYTFRRDPEFVSHPTAASTAYMPGDLIWNNGGVAAVASSFTWDTNLATTQPEFRLKFLGVCQDMKLATDASTAPISVKTSGVFEYPCAALGSAQHVGDCVGPAKDSGNNLRDQLLAIVSGPTLSVGVLAAEAALGATTLTVYIQSYLMFTKNASAT